MFTLLVCLFVSLSLCLVIFCQLLRYADIRIVNIMKVCITRNNEQLELMRYSKNVDFIHVLFCKTTDSMQYRPPNANQEFSNFRKQTILAPFMTVSADSRPRLNACRVLTSWTYHWVQ